MCTCARSALLVLLLVLLTLLLLLLALLLLTLLLLTLLDRPIVLKLPLLFPDQEKLLQCMVVRWPLRLALLKELRLDL